MVGLGDLSGGSFGSFAEGISADGSVVVGRSVSASGGEAFMWTSGGGMIGLGDLSGGSFSSQATDVSADGSVVVGDGTLASGAEAFVWDSTNGMQSISSILTNSGVDLTGWTLFAATDVSDDGLTIVGRGFNPSGFSEAWVANLGTEPIPEPATIALLGIGLAGLAGSEVRRRWKKKVTNRNKDI